MNKVLIVTAFLSLYASATAIQCYTCESVYDSDCAEDFEPENHFKLDCARIAPPRFIENEIGLRNASACMKKIYNEDGVKKIVRSCFFGDVNDTDIGCTTDPSLLGVEDLGCYVCDDVNYCNGSSDYYNYYDNILMIISLITCALLHSSQ